VPPVSAAALLPPGAVDAARAVLAGDRWSFVKTQAVAVLAKAPPSPEVDTALRGAMHDEAARVRQAAVLAAGLRHAGALRDPIRELLDDVSEDAEVRAAAARALGAVCDASSVDRLTALAQGVGVGGTTEDEQLICVGALTGLAAIHPPDLQDRLAPLLSKGASAESRAAARQALAARGVCR
jgi:HEAT repeat protein